MLYIKSETFQESEGRSQRLVRVSKETLQAKDQHLEQDVMGGAFQQGKFDKNWNLELNPLLTNNNLMNNNNNNKLN